jgi:acyl carrier protein
MSPEKMREQIGEIIHRVAPEADVMGIGPDENLRESLDIDSFDFLKIVVGLNEVFGVNVPESDYRSISSLAGMMTYLERKLGSTARG